MQLNKPTISDKGSSNLYYITNLGGYNEICEYECSHEFLDIVSKLYMDAADYINSVRLYPFDVRAHDVRNVTPLLNNEFWIGDAELVHMDNAFYSINSGYNEVLDMGSYHLSKLDTDNIYLNYAPFLAVDIYLPFIGFISVDPTDVMDCDLSFEYVVNFTDGSCTAYIFATGEDNVKRLITSKTGQIGVDIPMNQTDAAQKALKAAVTGASLVASVASGNILAAAIPTILGGAQNMNVRRIKGGESSGIAAFYAPQFVHIVLTQKVISEPASYNTIKGRPSNKTISTPAALAGTGFASFENFHLEGMGFGEATDAELAEIDEILKSGIIL